MSAGLLSVDPSRRHHTRGVVLMLVSASCFVVNVLLIHLIATRELVSMWILSSARFLVGLVLVAVFYPRDWRPANLLRSRKLAERGFVGGLTVIGFYETVVRLGAGRAAFINNTYVVWGALLAVFILREHLRPLLAAGGLLALAGIGFLTGAFSDATVSRYDVLAIVTAIGAGYVVVTIRQLHAREHTSTIFSAQCAYGLIFCLGPAALHWQSAEPLTWVLTALAGVCAGAGQLLMTHAFRELSVAEGSLLQMIVPLGTAIGETVLFHHHMTMPELIGGALILVGCALPAFRR